MQYTIEETVDNICQIAGEQNVYGSDLNQCLKDFTVSSENFSEKQILDVMLLLANPSRTDIDMKKLTLVRNYFGEHDKTQFEHWAYSFLDEIIKSKDVKALCPMCNHDLSKD